MKKNIKVTIGHPSFMADNLIVTKITGHDLLRVFEMMMMKKSVYYFKLRCQIEEDLEKGNTDSWINAVPDSGLIDLSEEFSF